MQHVQRGSHKNKNRTISNTYATFSDVHHRIENPSDAFHNARNIVWKVDHMRLAILTTTFAVATFAPFVALATPSITHPPVCARPHIDFFEGEDADSQIEQGTNASTASLPAPTGPVAITYGEGEEGLSGPYYLALCQTPNAKKCKKFKIKSLPISVSLNPTGSAIVVSTSKGLEVHNAKNNRKLRTIKNQDFPGYECGSAQWLTDDIFLMIGGQCDTNTDNETKHAFLANGKTGQYLASVSDFKEPLLQFRSVAIIDATHVAVAGNHYADDGKDAPVQGSVAVIDISNGSVPQTYRLQGKNIAMQKSEKTTIIGNAPVCAN